MAIKTPEFAKANESYTSFVTNFCNVIKNCDISLNSLHFFQRMSLPNYKRLWQNTNWWKAKTKCLEDYSYIILAVTHSVIHNVDTTISYYEYYNCSLNHVQYLSHFRSFSFYYTLAFNFMNKHCPNTFMIRLNFFQDMNNLYGTWQWHWKSITKPQKCNDKSILYIWIS